MSEAQTLPRPLGRPKATTDEKPNRFYDGKLYKLLEDRMENHVYRGQLNVASLAGALDSSRQSLYRWLTDDKLSAKAATALVKLSEGKITTEDLHPFVFV